ncbi:hypothetical protein ACC689_35050, partial [Rhizobium ruizarguesonis]
MDYFTFEIAGRAVASFRSENHDEATHFFEADRRSVFCVLALVGQIRNRDQEHDELVLDGPFGIIIEFIGVLD